MSLPLRTPSKRFIRAAESERAQLLAEQQRLLARHEQLIKEATDVLAVKEAVDQRLSALDTVLGVADHGSRSFSSLALETADADREMPPGTPSPEILSGPAIREIAVRVLLEQPEYIEALHYRDWYGLLSEAGYKVAGRDPQAVFLTQLTRSPVIRKSGQPGVYELDRQAPLRLRQKLERVRTELRDASNPSGVGGEPKAADIRQLTISIGRTERELDEALQVLRKQPADQGVDLDPEVEQRLTA